ncbi:MAG: CapA family protein [Armatimonadetes bacterium]|nr:CapA family protein [Armatimonadota bacterium]
MPPTRSLTLCMCGDVMTGRGIDQILPHPGDPTPHESYMRSALGYVELAERASGPIPRPVELNYIWGDLLGEIRPAGPSVLLGNLETAVTTRDDYWPEKGIHYRMHPANLPCLSAAGFDCLSLANNHVLDWGNDGLRETLDRLRSANLRGVGAGLNSAEAGDPAVIAVPGAGRVSVFAFGMTSSGIPLSWAAAPDRPGVNLAPDPPDPFVRNLGGRVRDAKKPGDIVVVSVHWGSNWVRSLPQSQIEFAHQLIDEAGLDVVHGHSSHHVCGIEVYRGQLILYSCGDFLTDYEGIGGCEAFRPDLGLLYRARLDSHSGRLLGLEMVPTRVRRLRVQRAGPADAMWLLDRLNGASRPFGTWVKLNRRGNLTLQWES